MIKETHPFNSKQKVDSLNKDDRTRPTTRRGFQRSLRDKERWKDMDEMNIMNENDHTYEIENIDMKGTT
jgi:hypothetical protein